MAITTGPRSRAAGPSTPRPTDRQERPRQAPAAPAAPAAEVPRYERVNNIVIRAEAYVRRHNEVVGIRGPDFHTGEQRSIALMPPDMAAEIMPNRAKSFETRAGEFLNKFAARPEVKDVALGSIIAFSDVYQVPGEQILSARWPNVMRQPGRPFDTMVGGLVSASYASTVNMKPGDSRRYMINVFDDQAAMTVDPRQVKAVAGLFSPVDQDGKLKQLQMLVGARNARGETRAYVLSHSVVFQEGQENASGKWHDSTNVVMRERYKVDPQTHVVTLDEAKWAEGGRAIMEHMVFGQTLTRSSGYAAGLLAAGMSSMGLEQAFERLNFRDDVPPEDREHLFALMRSVKDGHIELTVTPGARYASFESLNKRLNQDTNSSYAAGREPRLAGGTYYEGVVGLRSLLVANAAKPGDKESHLQNGWVHSLMEVDTTSRSPRMKLDQVAEHVFQKLDQGRSVAYGHDHGMSR